MVTYQGKAYNPFYPLQPNYGYQPYNQYDGSAAQRNYQSNSRPVARFPALSLPVQVVTSQPMGQLNNNAKGTRPQQKKFKPDPIPMTYTELYPKLVQGAYYRRLISHHFNHCTLDGIMRTSTAIIIQAIEDTLRKTNERSKTSSKEGS